MPEPDDKIVSLRIFVDTKGFGTFDIDAGYARGKYDFARTGGQSLPDQKLLKDVLRKVIASYPYNPIRLCIDSKNRIVDDQQCPPDRGPQPPANNCVITVTNRYKDGSQLDGFCTFIYTTALGQIEDVREAKALPQSARSALTFEQPIPGRVGAYHVHVVRKKPDGSEEHFLDGKIAQPGMPIYEDERYFPPINVNIASRAELEEIRGIGPVTSKAIADARQGASVYEY